jgi:sugar phosphate isomerase/epimerase
MQIGIFAKTFAVTGAEPVLGAVKQAGYETCQFNTACLGLASTPHEITEAQTHEIAEASRATGISIAAVSGTYNMIHPDPGVRADGLRRLGVMIASARAMGTSLVTLCTGTRDPDDQWRHHPDNDTTSAWRDLVTEMTKAAKLAETHGVDLGIEPELANVVSSPAKARQLIDEIASPHLRIVLDPANLFEHGTTQEVRGIVARAVELLGDRIAMAHAKDRDANGQFVAAGKGVIDFPHFIATLRQSGFDGPLITHGLSAAEAPSVAQFLRGSLDQ